MYELENLDLMPSLFAERDEASADVAGGREPDRRLEVMNPAARERRQRAFRGDRSVEGLREQTVDEILRDGPGCGDEGVVVGHPWIVGTLFAP